MTAAIATDVPVKIVILGHVDHGKSTLVGRLLHDTGNLLDGKVNAVEEMCRKRGMPFEWAFVMDALQSERDQGITVDVAMVRFATAERRYTIIDAPGHEEFLKNMVSGAALADAAILVVDLLEGVKEQSRRHAYVLQFLGIRTVVVAANKMDAVDWSEARFRALSGEVVSALADIGITANAIVPISARLGDGVVHKPANMPWYEGPTLLEALHQVPAPPQEDEYPLRFPIQDVYKFDERRIIAGRIESGRLRVGDRLLFAPSNKTARVRSIEGWNQPTVVEARAGQSIGITLDEPIFVERGEVVYHPDHAPIETTVFRARLFWMGHKSLKPGQALKMKLATAEHVVEVQQIDKAVDAAAMRMLGTDEVRRNMAAEVVLRSRSVIVLDEFNVSPRTGRFVLVDGHDTVAGGTINMDGYPVRRSQAPKALHLFHAEHRVDLQARWRANGHKSGILWFTGLSGAGKSTLGMEVEQRLFRRGWQVMVLDGDNVRHGLCSDLDFSPEGRAENIRRVGEVAHLMAEGGTLVIAAFISPYRADRDRVRQINPDMFHEVYIDCGLETCEQRDPKGLYKLARAGKLADFTGISAPYEEPVSPELVVDTKRSLDDSVAALLKYIDERFQLDLRLETEWPRRQSR